MTGASELDLILRPHAEEHLKLEAVAADAVAVGEFDDVLDDPFVVGGDGGEAAFRQHALR